MHTLRANLRRAPDHRLSLSLRTLRELTSGRLFGYLARRPGNRADTARCPRGRAGTRERASGERLEAASPEGSTLADNIISTTDAAVRKRVEVLSVHVPCGGIRGPIQRGTWPGWQSCRCEDRPVRWQWADVSRAYDLCVVCFRATAGGPSRWSWLACENCRAVNREIGEIWGFDPFKLGRHSLMNGVGVRPDGPPDVRDAQVVRLREFARGDVRLRDWRRTEYPRLASSFDHLADVPLKVWQRRHPAGWHASHDAFARLIGPGFPDLGDRHPPPTTNP